MFALKGFSFKFSQCLILKFVMASLNTLPEYLASLVGMKKCLLNDSKVKLWHFQKKTKMNAL